VQLLNFNDFVKISCLAGAVPDRLIAQMTAGTDLLPDF
jgi:hypothetical protein